MTACGAERSAAVLNRKRHVQINGAWLTVTLRRVVSVRTDPRKELAWGTAKVIR